MIVAVIPARGGSKAIPNKNVVLIGGKPLIVWSIEQALASQAVDIVVVATDSESIADVARSAGATVVERSPESCTDDAPSEMVLTEVVNDYQDAEAIVFLQATSPFRHENDIDGAVDVMRTEKADSVISMREVRGYTWFLAGGNLQKRFFRRQPRQLQGGVLYEENGSIYVFRPHVLMKEGMRYGGKIAHYVMDPLDSFQIDEVEDIQLFERILRLHERNVDVEQLA